MLALPFSPTSSSSSLSDSSYSSCNSASPTPSTSSTTSSASSKGSSSSRKWVRKEKIGQGAQGSVYRCEEVGSGREIAAKIILIQDLSVAEIEAIKREVRTMKRLEHRYLVHYHKATEKQNRKLIIYMEHVAGGSLSSKLRKGGPLSMPKVKKFTRQLCQVLQYLHANRIAHRDIKCANIFLSASQKCIKLGDFGAFKEIGSVSLVGGIKGTPHWMAPEVIREAQTSEDGWLKADIWSLGCAVLEMLTGHSPWQQYSNPLTAMYQIVSSNSTPTIPADASEETASFLKWCLQRNPDDRPTTTQLLAHPFLTKDESSRRKSSTSSSNTSSSSSQRKSSASSSSTSSTGQSLPKLQQPKRDPRPEQKIEANVSLEPHEHGDDGDDSDVTSPFPLRHSKKKSRDADNDERERSADGSSLSNFPQVAAAEPAKERRKKSLHANGGPGPIHPIPTGGASGALKPSRIPRLKPLELVRSPTNQHESTQRSPFHSPPALEKPGVLRSVSAGPLSQLPRLSNNSSKALVSTGISIDPVRLRRISTAPMAPGHSSGDRRAPSHDKFKLPPLLSARNVAGS
ncbi:hypothetical protein Gpo141_00007445 [Globisporangium polare]